MNTDSETALLDIGTARRSLDSLDRTDLDFWYNPRQRRPLDDARTGNPEPPEEHPLESSTEGWISFLPKQGMIARTTAGGGIHLIWLSPRAYPHIGSKFKRAVASKTLAEMLRRMAEALFSETAQIQEGPLFIDYLDDYLNARTRLERIDRSYQQFAPSHAASGWWTLQLRHHTPLDLPKVISIHLETLHNPGQREEEMYAAVDAIVEWLAEGTEEQEAAIVDPVQSLPPTGKRILFSACADAELHLSHPPLLRAIARCVSAHDKRLAQAATASLLLCGGAFGKSLLQEALRDVTAVPHAQLVRGIIALLNRQ